MLSYTVPLGKKKKKKNIFGWRNIMFGQRNLHMLSLFFLYFPSKFYIHLSPRPDYLKVDFIKQTELLKLIDALISFVKQPKTNE